MKESELIEYINKAVKNNQNQSQPVAADTRPEKSETHKFASFKKTCEGGCGAINPEYKPPDTYCTNCGYPMGTTPVDFDGGETDAVKPCTNCGGKSGKRWIGWHDDSDD